MPSGCTSSSAITRATQARPAPPGSSRAGITTARYSARSCLSNIGARLPNLPRKKPPPCRPRNKKNKMGKITGFLEIEREDRGYQPVAERIKHWHEFVLPLPEKELRAQAARCMDCGVPYCHGTSRITGLPTGC